MTIGSQTIQPTPMALEEGKTYPFKHFDGSTHKAVIEQVYWDADFGEWRVKAKVITKNGAAKVKLFMHQFEDAQND